MRDPEEYIILNRAVREYLDQMATIAPTADIAALLRKHGDLCARDNKLIESSIRLLSESRELLARINAR